MHQQQGVAQAGQVQPGQHFRRQQFQFFGGRQ